MNRILYDVPRWSIYLHRNERKLPFVKDDDSKDLRFEDEVFERLYNGDMTGLGRDIDHRSAPWAKQGHKMCDDLGLNEVVVYCRDASFNSALATAWLMELIEDPLGGAKADAEAAGGQDGALVEGMANVDFGDLGGTGKGRTEAIAAYLRSEPRLLQITLLAGRLRSSVITKQRSKKAQGAQEIVDITIGGELERIIPAELVRFASKRLKLAVMRDFIERKLMQYEMTAVEPLQQGPIVVVLDKSGSMGGERDVWASAVALSMLDVAQRQKRAFAIVSFNERVLDVVFVEAGGKLNIRDLMILPDGGTYIGNALGVSLDAVQRNSIVTDADVILISDGEDDDKHAAEVLKRRAAGMGVTIFGVGIATKHIGMWCHRSHVIEDLSSVDEMTMDMLFTI